METRQCVECNEVRTLDRFAGIRKVCKNCANVKLKAKRDAAKVKPKFHGNQPKIVLDDRMTATEKARRNRAAESVFDVFEMN